MSMGKTDRSDWLLRIDAYVVKNLHVRNGYHHDKWEYYMPLPSWEALYLDMPRADNDELVNHLIDAHDTNARLKLSLNDGDKIRAFFTTVEYIFDDDGTINLALHFVQELCENDDGTLCLRAVSAETE